MSKTTTINIDHSKTWFKYQVRTEKDITPVGNVFLKNNKLVYEKDLTKTQFLPSSMMNIIAKKVSEDGYVVVVTDMKKSE